MFQVRLLTPVLLHVETADQHIRPLSKNLPVSVQYVQHPVVGAAREQHVKIPLIYHKALFMAKIVLDILRPGLPLQRPVALRPHPVSLYAGKEEQLPVDPVVSLEEHALGQPQDAGLQPDVLFTLRLQVVKAPSRALLHINPCPRIFLCESGDPAAVVIVAVT